MKPVFFALIVLFNLIIFAQPGWAYDKETIACLEQIKPLLKKKDQVAELDGIWGLFQKTPEFWDNSTQSINLDRSINTILFHLDYLCTTLHGIPFNELANYVSKNLAEKDEAQFRKELLVLGRGKEELDIWFKFITFAIANEHRVLLPQNISRTIKLSTPYFEKYLELAENIERKEGLNIIIEQTENLIDQIDLFLNSDPSLSQSVFENSQVPYVDWDENHGGS